MGMFDFVVSEHPLPDARMQATLFQSKSMNCLLEKYVITVDGRLFKHRTYHVGHEPPPEPEPEPEPEPVPDFHGDLYFYTLDKRGGKSEWFEYRARFTHGKLDTIIRVAEGEDPERN